MIEAGIFILGGTVSIILVVLLSVELFLYMKGKKTQSSEDKKNG